MINLVYRATHFQNYHIFFNVLKCAANYVIQFEVYDGFIVEKSLKLWRQESWPFGPGWATHITSIRSWTFRLPWSLHKERWELTVLIYILWSSATAVASCPAGAEKLSANNQVARLPYTLFHCICSYHHSTFWQKNQENLSDKQTTYFVSQYNTSQSMEQGHQI